MNSSQKESQSNRIIELLTRLENPPQTGMSTILNEVYQYTLNLLPGIYGIQSIQMTELREVWKSNSTINGHHVNARHTHLLGLLRATASDLENDYIANPLHQATGSVLGDFIGSAKVQLDEGYKDVAAVLACAAFEDAMKRKAQELGMETEDRELMQIVNGLRAERVFQGAQSSIVTGFIRLRNSAMHADWEKVRPPEVSSLIGFTEQFLLEHFS